MPFQPIPFSQYGFGGPGMPAAPQQGQTVTALWPLAVPYPPQPVERYWLSSFYVPLYVSASGPTLPTVCDVTAQLFLSGGLVFQAESTLSLTPVATAPAWAVGGGSANASLNQPVAYDSGQTLQAGFTARLDQTVTQLWVVLAGIQELPIVVGVPPTPAPGSFGYDVELIGAPT